MVLCMSELQTDLLEEMLDREISAILASVNTAKDFYSNREELEALLALQDKIAEDRLENQNKGVAVG